MNYWILAYYAIVKLDDPHAEVFRHKEFFKDRDFRGRIYISEQGINGQSSGSVVHAHEYIDWLHADPRFKDVQIKVHEAQEHAFPKMTVKYRKQLVAIDCEVDFANRGESVSPQVWKKMLEERTAETVVLDVRNNYEWKAGHFEGAKLPTLETFREFPAYAKQLKETCDPKATPVMMYCTGGIRCEYYSAVLKQEGFEKVYQLDGGVIQYGLEEGSAHWEGKLFVFDDRLMVSLDDQGSTISLCGYCGSPSNSYYNCANMDCNELFFCCLDCLRMHQGCCCDVCVQEGRVRPFQENAKPFRKWAHEEKVALISNIKNKLQFG
ncbi:MAG: rhodanese-related sulfurtransferase [Chlamydiia bacterium]|nr:rhodanese-related sulfurtransferase [Chlamydiia bacterium]